jgi:hypothetical protein
MEKSKREAETIRDVLAAQERALKADFMLEAAMRPMASVGSGPDARRFHDAEEQRWRDERERTAEELIRLRDERADAILRVIYLYRLRMALEEQST